MECTHRHPPLPESTSHGNNQVLYTDTLTPLGAWFPMWRGRQTTLPPDFGTESVTIRLLALLVQAQDQLPHV